MRNAEKIAIPPKRAVGFVCHRSFLGGATFPKRCASLRTTSVRARLSKKVQVDPIMSDISLKLEPGNVSVVQMESRSFLRRLNHEHFVVESMKEWKEGRFVTSAISHLFR
jgi:hypothetical protein